jgi:hypothetical protein
MSTRLLSPRSPRYGESVQSELAGGAVPQSDPLSLEVV